MIEKVVTYRLSSEERETHYHIAYGDEYAYCDTTIPKDIRKLTARGWEMVSCDRYSDGTMVAAKFRAPANCLSIRNNSPDKPKRTISEEHLRKLQDARKNNSV